MVGSGVALLASAATERGKHQLFWDSDHSAVAAPKLPRDTDPPKKYHTFVSHSWYPRRVSDPRLATLAVANLLRFEPRRG